MWKKLLKLRPLALQFTQMEVHNGLLTSFWFDQWSHLGVLINLTGERGCIDLGISINTTPYRLRRHRTSVFIEREILRLRALAPDLSDDICLWKRENNEFRPGFLTTQTWNLTRVQAPHVPWLRAFGLKRQLPSTPFWLG